MTRPFVFRRYVDYTAFAAMRDMKAMIEREVLRRHIEDDIKLGAGGIREIEFIVQVFQLIYGGSKRELQDRQCLVSLEHIGEAGLLEKQAVLELEDAYLFYAVLNMQFRLLTISKRNYYPKKQIYDNAL